MSYCFQRVCLRLINDQNILNMSIFILSRVPQFPLLRVYHKVVRSPDLNNISDPCYVVELDKMPTFAKNIACHLSYVNFFWPSDPWALRHIFGDSLFSGNQQSNILK